MASENQTDRPNDTVLLAGASGVDITPEPGSPLHGGELVARKASDPLCGKAVVFDDGEHAAALVTVDVCLMSEELIDACRQQIEARTGIAGEAVMFAASHTHSGPPMVRWLSQHIRTDYMKRLQEKLATAVENAWESRAPARVGAGAGELPLTLNRWILTDEGARWGPAWERPHDDALSIVRIDREDGTPLATVANFAAHASVVSAGKTGMYSADYPGFVQSSLERRHEGMVAAFTNGASGDLKLTFATDDRSDFRYGDADDARRYGEQIGEEADRIHQSISTRAGVRVTTASVRCELPLQAWPSEEMLEQEMASPEFSLSGDLWAREMLEKVRSGDVYQTMNKEVQVLRLGDVAAFVALPGEPFVEIGLRIKRILADRAWLPIVVGYANGYGGYLPTDRSTRLDGDRPRYNWYKIVGMPAVYADGMEERLVEAVERATACVNGTSSG